MKTNNLFVGIGIGFAIGFIASKQLSENKISPDSALKTVKREIANANIGKVIGTWIQTQTEKYVKNGLPYVIYNGGVSSKNNETERQFNFKIDAKTGTIIELNEE